MDGTIRVGGCPGHGRTKSRFARHPAPGGQATGRSQHGFVVCGGGNASPAQDNSRGGTPGDLDGWVAVEDAVRWTFVIISGYIKRGIGRDFSIVVTSILDGKLTSSLKMEKAVGMNNVAPLSRKDPAGSRRDIKMTFNALLVQVETVPVNGGVEFVLKVCGFMRVK